MQLKSSYRTLRSVTLIGASLGFSQHLAAAPTVPATAGSASVSTEAPTTGASKLPQTKGPLYVELEQRGFDIEPQSLRDALAKELGMPLTLNEVEAGVRVRVVADADTEVSVTFRDRGQSPQVRAVRSPARGDEVPELAALLAGNLARDSSAALIAQMNAQVPEQKVDASVGSAANDTNAPADSSSVSDETPDETVAPALQHNFFNVSFFAPIASCPDSDQRRFNVEIGSLYSHVGGLNGFGVNGLVLRVNQQATGFLVGGVAQVQHGSVSGASIAGAVNVAQGQSVGGLQLGGAVNVAAGIVGGAQIAGALSTAAQVDGLQLSGALSHSTKIEGAQISGALNLANDSLTGFQLSTVNITQHLKGAQIGIVNVGGEVNGLQLGIVNIAKRVDGASIGMVTYSEEGRTQLVTWYNTTQPLNVGARFYTGPLYAMPTIGYDVTDTESVYPGLSLGARLWAGQVFVDLEGNFQNRLFTGAGDSDVKFDEHDIELRYRLLLGYELTPWFGVFAGGGVLHSLHTDAPVEEDVKPEFTFGVQFF